MKAETEYQPQDVSVGWDHSIMFQVFEVDSAQKENIRNMGLNKLFAILENNITGEGKFEVFGIGVGLEMLTGTRINADIATQGSFSINLRTPANEGGKEQNPPNNFWDGDVATTRPKIDALLTPAT